MGKELIKYVHVFCNKTYKELYAIGHTLYVYKCMIYTCILHVHVSQFVQFVLPVMYTNLVHVHV